MEEHTKLCKIQSEQKNGPGYWKMNSGIINDPQYTKEMEEVVKAIDELNLQSPIDWWDTFIMLTRSITIDYSRKKTNTKPIEK